MEDVLAMKSRAEKAQVYEYLLPCSVLAAIKSFFLHCIDAIKSYESIFCHRPFKAWNNILFHPCTVRIQITWSTFELLETLECEAHANVSKSAAGGVGAKAFQV